MSQLARLILEAIENSIKPRNDIIKASVKSPPPNLTLEYAGETIPSEQIYCSNYLLPHYHRSFTIDGVIDEITVDTSSSNKTGYGPASHTHEHGTVKGNGLYKSHKDIWLEDTLKVGDEVLVVILGIYYVVVTKITKMPNGAIEGV